MLAARSIGSARKSGDVFTCRHFLYVGLASRFLMPVPASSAPGASQICASESSRKRKWFCTGGNVCVQGVNIAWDEEVALFFINTNKPIGKQYRFFFLNEWNFLREAFVHEIPGNKWRAILSTAMKGAFCIDAFSIYTKMCAKVRRCLSDELGSWNRKTRDLLFASPGYPFCPVGHASLTRESDCNRKF